MSKAAAVSFAVRRRASEKIEVIMTINTRNTMFTKLAPCQPRLRKQQKLYFLYSAIVHSAPNAFIRVSPLSGVPVQNARAGHP